MPEGAEASSHARGCGTCWFFSRKITRRIYNELVSLRRPIFKMLRYKDTHIAAALCIGG